MPKPNGSAFNSIGTGLILLAPEVPSLSHCVFIVSRCVFQTSVHRKSGHSRNRLIELHVRAFPAMYVCVYDWKPRCIELEQTNPSPMITYGLKSSIGKFILTSTSRLSPGSGK